MPVKKIVRGQSVSYEMHERAKKLRREMTPAEKVLWKELRTNKLEVSISGVSKSFIVTSRISIVISMS